MNWQRIAEHLVTWAMVGICAAAVATWLDVRDLKKDVRVIQQYMARGE